MKLFGVFVFFLLGLLAGTFSPGYLALTLFPLSYLLFYRKKGPKSLFFLSATLVGFLLASFFPKGESGTLSLSGIIVYRKSSYCFLLTLRGKYLLYDKEGKLSLFSVVSMTGVSKTPVFSHYEGSFDFLGYLHSHGVSYVFYPTKTVFLFSSPFQTDPLRSYLFLDLDPTPKKAVSSLLFGDSLFGIDEMSLVEELGLSSLLSLSGFHLSFFLRILRKLFGKRVKKGYGLLELLFLLPFLFLSGFRYTLRRIFLAHLLSLLNERRKERIPSLELLSLTAMILLFFEPYSLLSPSFYYPFPLLFFLRLMPREKEKKKSVFFFFILITIFYLPLRLLDRKGFNFYSPFLQILLIPYTHFLFLVSLLLFLIPQVGFLLNLLIPFLFRIAALGESVPFVLESGVPSVLVFLLFYVGLFFSLFLFTYHYERPGRALILFSLVVLGTCFFPDFTAHEEITFLDVDQGDCTLVRDQRTSFLIDTGGKTTVDLAQECLIPYFRKEKIRSLDYVVITHLDYDHYGALESLRKHFPIGKVLYAEDFLKEKDHTFTLGEVKVKNLNEYEVGEDTNAHSGVYSFSIRSTKVLVMGDAPRAVEKKILESKEPIQSDLLKVGHHGSKTSSDPLFLQAVAPKMAIISVGRKNSYGLPDEETLLTLQSLSIPYRRTDEEGTITYRF
jgi:competence protein ComEC